MSYAHRFIDDAEIQNTETVTGHTTREQYDLAADILSAQLDWGF